MLIEFTVGNFKSFNEKTTFSMVAANLTSEDPALDRDNVIVVNKKLNLLKTAALYGANASGKSNFGLALLFMREFILNFIREASNPRTFGLEPFLLNHSTRENPSFFEIVFLVNGVQYRYGFEATRSEVVSEWLFHVPKTKEVALFLREKQEFSVRAGFKEGKGLEVRTRPGILFLSIVAFFNGEFAQKVDTWFSQFVVISGLIDKNNKDYTIQCLEDPSQKGDILSLIRLLDLDINDIYVQKSVVSVLWDEITQEPKFQDPYKIYTSHRFGDALSDDQLFELDVHESQGTQKLVAMAGPLLDILKNGRTMFIDEFDARLHPLMTRRIIELFHSPLTNPKGAQLIFATHDTNLLDKNLFRRDQIWFVEKDSQKATHLTSLAEYRPRNDAAFEKNYLEGRYGAIPFLGDLERLPWADGHASADEETIREMAHA